MDDLASFAKKEIDTCAKKKDEINSKITQLNEELATIDRRMIAAQHYLDALEGKAQTVKTRAPGSSTGTRSPRSGSLRGQVLVAITKHQPASRKQIIEAVGIKGDKKKEQNLSNMLVNLKKGGFIKHAEDGTYTISSDTGAIGVAALAGKR